MIISRGRFYVFVHIPKTGGTSMALALEARAQHDDLLIGDTPKARRRRKRLEGLTCAGRLWKHSTLSDIDGVLSSAELKEMFTFTLVRNPWDRVVSYYHWLRDQQFDHPAVQIARATDFAAFVRNPVIAQSLSASPAVSYMRDAQGTERCNAYIRLENFAEDVRPLEHHLGFSLSLPRANVSLRRRDVPSHYDVATAECVAEICADDIARFSYTFPANG